MTALEEYLGAQYRDQDGGLIYHKLTEATGEGGSMLCMIFDPNSSEKIQLALHE